MLVVGVVIGGPLWFGVAQVLVEMQRVRRKAARDEGLTGCAVSRSKTHLL